MYIGDWVDKLLIWWVCWLSGLRFEVGSTVGVIITVGCGMVLNCTDTGGGVLFDAAGLNLSLC